MPRPGGPFYGRSVSVVHDLSADEQWFLYRKTAEIKAAVVGGSDLAPYRFGDPELSVYLIFLEDSTRTKESFRNAALFHQARVIDFDVAHSSFNKKESLTDTLKMLVGYSRRSLFVMRSTVEGVTRALEASVGEYCRRAGLAPPSFVNAGDGRHEHPTQEFLDEFTFLEKKAWDRSTLHIALTGDLHFGRTVHSKADGLRIFDRVLVDLVAPADLALPDFYLRKMLDNGFTVRRFETIDEYLAQGQVADVWYFTRLQLERMGEDVLERIERLKHAVTIRSDHLSLLPEGTKFFHPLPQNRVAPTIPDFVTPLSLNGWDEQSRNGYFTRIALLGLLAGAWAAEFSGPSRDQGNDPDDFVEEAEIKPQTKTLEYKTGIKPVDDGIVIDHVGRGGPSPRSGRCLTRSDATFSWTIWPAWASFPQKRPRG